jgi:hypothetical protein
VILCNKYRLFVGYCLLGVFSAIFLVFNYKTPLDVSYLNNCNSMYSTGSNKFNANRD